MGRERDIRRSILKRVRGLFQSPPAGSGLSAYTVYAEDDLRAVMKKALVPARPSVFVTDSYLRPAEPALPLVIVEVSPTLKRPFELGNTAGREPGVILHVFGRLRGERDDLTSFLADYFGRSLPIYNYTSGSPVFSDDTVVGNEMEIESVPVLEKERTEGSYDSWNTISFKLLAKS